MGRDWIINVAVPNKILGKYPTEVLWLQTQIKVLLEEFNKNIQKLEKGVIPTAKIEEFGKKEKLPKNIRDSVLLKMQEDKKKESSGGGHNL